MNALTRWNPLQELEEAQNRLAGLFGSSRFPLKGKDGDKELMMAAEWSPSVDISEDKSGYHVKADLPDVKKEDIKVTVSNGVLMLSGERKFEKEEKDKKYHRIERAFGSFMRTFDLPEDAAPDKVTAEFKDGVLKVHIEKSEMARPKEITVKTS